MKYEDFDKARQLIHLVTLYEGRLKLLDHACTSRIRIQVSEPNGVIMDWRAGAGPDEWKDLSVEILKKLRTNTEADLQRAKDELYKL